MDETSIEALTRAAANGGEYGPRTWLAELTYGTEVPYVSWLDTYNYIRVGQAGTPVLIRNVRRYNLPYAEAKARIDSLMA